MKCFYQLDIIYVLCISDVLEWNYLKQKSDFRFHIETDFFLNHQLILKGCKSAPKLHLLLLSLQLFLQSVNIEFASKLKTREKLLSRREQSK